MGNDQEQGADDLNGRVIKILVGEPMPISVLAERLDAQAHTLQQVCRELREQGLICLFAAGDGPDRHLAYVTKKGLVEALSRSDVDEPLRGEGDGSGT